MTEFFLWRPRRHQGRHLEPTPLPGGLRVRRVALDGLPQDLDRQHRLDPFSIVRRIATYVFRRTADLRSSNPTPMKTSPETTGPSIGMPPVFGTAL